jgi:hypothetical protein
MSKYQNKKKHLNPVRTSVGIEDLMDVLVRETGPQILSFRTEFLGINVMHQTSLC